MFLVSDSSAFREKRIKQILVEDPPLAALLSVIHFEWTVRRAIITLGISPNVEIRERIKLDHGCDKYKQVWKDEVFQILINVSSKAQVDAVMEQARSAGAVIVKPPHETFWGGYASYFADPDQHLWEVVWNPQLLVQE